MRNAPEGEKNPVEKVKNKATLWRRLPPSVPSARTQDGSLCASFQRSAWRVDPAERQRLHGGLPTLRLLGSFLPSGSDGVRLCADYRLLLLLLLLLRASPNNQSEHHGAPQPTTPPGASTGGRRRTFALFLHCKNVVLLKKSHSQTVHVQVKLKYSPEHVVFVYKWCD